MSADLSNNDILNTVVRMVIPLRREFGRQLDVRQFLRGGAYADEVLDMALASRDARLAEYARSIERHLHRARVPQERTAAASHDDDPDHPRTVPAAFDDTHRGDLPEPPEPHGSASDIDADIALLRQVMSRYSGGQR